jgi:hypothetical protein
MFSVASCIGRRAIARRQFSEVAMASVKQMRFGDKAGVGLRYRMPKVAKSRVPPAAELTDSQRNETFQYWKGVKPQLNEYSTEELQAYFDEFRQHASLDKMHLTAFQRFVKTKCKDINIKPQLMPTLSYELWNVFDEDTGNYIDFGEFVVAYPRMVKTLVRFTARDVGVEEFFNKYGIEGEFTAASVEAMVDRYALNPFTQRDAKNLLMMIAPDNPDAASLDDVSIWALDFSSVTAPSLHF